MNRFHKKNRFFTTAAGIFILFLFYVQFMVTDFSGDTATGVNLSGDLDIKDAFDRRLEKAQAVGIGTVINILDDDNKGVRHQRFTVQLKSKQTNHSYCS